MAGVVRKTRLKWASHVAIRMEQERMVKSIMDVKVEGIRAKGRPKQRWMDSVELEEIVTSMKVKNRRRVAQVLTLSTIILFLHIK